MAIHKIALLFLFTCIIAVTQGASVHRRALADDIASTKDAIARASTGLNRILDALAAAAAGGAGAGAAGGGGAQQQQQQQGAATETVAATAAPATATTESAATAAATEATQTAAGGAQQTGAATPDLSAVTAALTAAGVIPDVIDAFTPTIELKVTYPVGDVTLGNNITPQQAATQPIVTYTAAATDLFTIIMTDPDVPSRAEARNGQFRHWTFVNIKGSDVANGTPGSVYLGPGPPPGSGPHRYTFLLFKQPGQLDPAALGINNNNRAQFRAQTFATQQGLTLVGANFMLSENP
ncbi:hypothetical protein PhCBS80983_g03300 [Powellomyces hirtus]|uniref:Phosphatidylethanolamine-binding protein n=1 Tax=Powellomyces hirtus TaxID=109895 RepID=A0A507E4W2_9FUNG|nr:hypothetical protein PhCBS80983_g03300 [Powellomyces hirtus]